MEPSYVREYARRPRTNPSTLLMLDTLLVAMGCSAVWLATSCLSFTDPRPMMNAWTYVAAIPAVLIVLDILLRSVVSRLVERTLMIAFLISILLHLLLTIGSIRLIIFSGSLSSLMSAAPTSTAPVEKSADEFTSVEFFNPIDSESADNPEYMLPAKTEDAMAAEQDLSKQFEENATNVANGDLAPETQASLNSAELKQAELEMDEPEIESQAAQRSRPESNAVEIYESRPVDVPQTNQFEEMPSTAELAANNQIDQRSRPVPQASLSDSVLSKVNIQPSGDVSNAISPSQLNASQVQRRTQSADMPAIESQQAALGRRDLSGAVDANRTIASSTPVPLLDLPENADGDFDPKPLTEVVPDSSGSVAMSRRAARQNAVTALPNSIPVGPSELSNKSRGIPGQRKTAKGDLVPTDIPGQGQPAKIARGSGLSNGDSSNGKSSQGGTSASGSSSGFTPSPIASSSRVPLPSKSVGSGTAKDAEDSASMGAAVKGDLLGASSVDGDKKRTSRQPPGSSMAKLGKGPGALEIGNEELMGPRSESRRSPGRAATGAGTRRSGLANAEPSMGALEASAPMKLPRRSLGSPTLDKPAVPIPAPAFQQRMARNDGSLDNSQTGEFGPDTEAAIERGLEFLARKQRNDGSWHLEDFGDNPRLRSDTAATALALLAFQGAGYSHRQYQYAPVCKSALEFLISHQKQDGDLYIPMDEMSNLNARFYSHSIASLALCEAFGMTQDEALREPAQRAVSFMVKTQDPVGGGWRYQPGFESDTSVSGWFMMALKSAELSGLEVPKPTFEKIRGWLDRAQSSPQQRYLYRYNPLAADTPSTRHGRVPNPTMTGVGLLMRLYLGWRRDNEDMALGADYLLANMPAEGTVTNPQRDTYYWYYATQVLFHMGGDRWKKWNSQLHPILIKSQVLSGDMTGSWDPTSPTPDRWGVFAGRLYVTTLNLLSLEVYYRHLPIYEDSAR